MIYLSIFVGGFMIAVAAFVYCVILTEPKMLLHEFAIWLDKKIGYRANMQEGVGFGFDRNPKPKSWLFLVLIGCPRCVTGQLAFWSYLIFHFTGVTYLNTYHWEFHLFFVSWSIYIHSFINYKYNQWNQTK